MQDVVVVGAGTYGLSAAIELRRRGAAVLVVDPGPIPHPDAASTDISKLIRADYGDDVLYSELMEAALVRWRAWNARWQRPLFHETGLLVLSGGALDARGFEGASFETLSARGYALERLDAAALRERFPAWSSEVAAYVNPIGGWAESGNVVRELASEARALGVTLREGVSIAPISGRSGPLREIATTGGETLSASSFVIAAGALTPHVVPELADRLRTVGQPVFHFGGDAASKLGSPAFLPWAADIANTGWYGFPFHEGVLKIANHGPGKEVAAGEARVVDAAWEARFRAFFAANVPSMAGAPVVRTRLCLYCDSFDGDFLIARHPARDGLVVAAGDSGHGFKFAPMFGELIADAVEGTNSPERARFAERFRWRERGPAKLEAARYGARS